MSALREMISDWSICASRDGTPGIHPLQSNGLATEVQAVAALSFN